MKTNGPWKIKESKEKYQNHWMKVYEDKVVRPDGKDGVCGIVKMLDGVCILPIDDLGYIYLIEQFRYALGKNTIEVAGGSIKKSEKKENVAKRELKEETGIESDNIELFSEEDVIGDKCRRGADNHRWHLYVGNIESVGSIKINDEGKKPV